MLIAISVFSRSLFQAFPHLPEEVDFQIFIIGSVLFAGYYINRVAPRTMIPSFVWAIFAGLALQPLLSYFTHNVSGLKIIIEVLAAIVLFAGGLEVPFSSFKKNFFPIASLSLVGVIVSAVLFSTVLFFITRLFTDLDFSLLPSIIIVSAALASTDPTAIIPTLRRLKFKRAAVKEIAISETAMTDISGSMLTRFLLIALVSVELTSESTILNYFLPLLQKPVYDAFALQIVSGILVGAFGFALLRKFYSNKKADAEVDPALLISVPIFTFVLGNVLGGAGFLAAFVSGLLADVSGEIKKAAHFYDSLLNHLIKPFIFIILGALVPFETLAKLAPLGILASLIFMFVIRPVVVFVSLLPWFMQGEFKWGDLIFLSLIRETGIIAAVLIIIASTYHLIDSDFVIAIGMWVILLTLIIESPLTPILAKKVGVAEDD